MGLKVPQIRRSSAFGHIATGIDVFGTGAPYNFGGTPFTILEITDGPAIVHAISISASYDTPSLPWLLSEVDLRVILEPGEADEQSFDFRLSNPTPASDPGWYELSSPAAHGVFLIKAILDVMKIGVFSDPDTADVMRLEWPRISDRSSTAFPTDQQVGYLNWPIRTGLKIEVQGSDSSSNSGSLFGFNEIYGGAIYSKGVTS